MRSSEPAGVGDPGNGLRSASSAYKAVAAAIVALAAAAALFLARGSPLSGDEPLYGLRSRSFRLREAVWFEWPSYRAPGLPLLAAPLVSLPEPVLRGVIVAFAAASVGLVYLLGQSLFGRKPAMWAAVVFAATPGLLVSSVYFLPDVPGLCLVLVAVVCLVRYLVGNGTRWWLALMVGSLTVAGLVRFSIAIVVLGALVALLIAVPSLVSTRRTRVLMVGGLLLVVTVAGNFVPAIGSQDGLSPWAANRQLVSQNASPLSRRVVSLADTSSLAYGFPRQAVPKGAGGAVFLAICGAGLVVGLVNGRRNRDRLVLFPIAWFLLTLGFYLIALDHFEIRYLTPHFVPVALIGGAGLASLGETVGRRWAAVLIAVTLVAGLSFGTYLISDFLRADDAEDLAVRDVGNFIAAAGQDCSVRFGAGGGKVWQLPWYSGCHSPVTADSIVYVAVWRSASDPASPPQADAQLVHSRDFTLTKKGASEHRVIDLYQLSGDVGGPEGPAPR